MISFSFRIYDSDSSTRVYDTPNDNHHRHHHWHDKPCVGAGPLQKFKPFFPILSFTFPTSYIEYFSILLLPYHSLSSNPPISHGLSIKNLLYSVDVRFIKHFVEFMIVSFFSMLHYLSPVQRYVSKSFFQRCLIVFSDFRNVQISNAYNDTGFTGTFYICIFV